MQTRGRRQKAKPERRTIELGERKEKSGVGATEK